MRGFKIRDKFSQIAFVFGESYKTSDAVTLPCAAAAARHLYLLQFTAHCPHQSGAIGQAAKIELEWSLPIQATQGTDAIAGARQQYREFRFSDGSVHLQLRWRLKLNTEA
jgi:hypothetical protein